MSRITALLLVLILCVPRSSHAQPEGDLVGWTGLILTPVGAFAPVVTGKLNAGARSTGLHVRVSRFGFDDVDANTTNVGAGFVLARGKARTSFDLGYVNFEQCTADNCGLIMAGADVQYDLAQVTGDNATLVALLNPAVGVGIPRAGGGSILTAGLSLPVAVSINAGSQLRLVPFVSPGFAFSRLDTSEETANGSRATVAGGVGFGSQSSPLLLSLTARKIFLDGVPTIYGVGISFGR